MSVKHRCVQCGKWRPAPEVLYFTEFRGWACDDCKYHRAVNSGKKKVSAILKAMEKDK